MTRRTWAETDIARLRSLAPHLGADDLAKLFDATATAIRSQAYLHKIPLSADAKAKAYRLARQGYGRTAIMMIAKVKKAVAWEAIQAARFAGVTGRASTTGGAT